MVNQQLTDYINEQVRVGVSKDAIKGALLEAGWAADEVAEAMGGGGTSRVDAVAPVITVKPVVQNFPAAVAAAKPMASVGGAGMDSAARPNITVRSIGPTQQPVTMNTASTATTTTTSHHMGGHRIIDIIMGLLILMLGGASTMLFIKNSSLAKELGLAANEKGTVATQLTTASSQNKTLETENDSLRAEKKVFESELAVVVSAKASGEEQVEVKGTLTGPVDSKAPYTLRTLHNLIVTIKNSRLPVVEAMLAPSVGSEVQILASHQVGSKDLTALAVNGTSVPASTSTVPR